MTCNKIYHKITFASENKEKQKKNNYCVCKAKMKPRNQEKKTCDIVYHKICCKSEQIIQMSYIC